jgi:hypothetical protein
VPDRCAALVKGPSVLFPRGFLWLIPAWYAAIALLLDLKGKTPVWYGEPAQGGLLLAALTLLCVLATMRNNAFVADGTGIWLGLRAGATRRLGRRRRALRHLPWAQVEQVQIRRRSYGARLDVILGDAAPIVGWTGAVGKIATAGLLLIFPLSYVGRTPGLLSARSSPPGYRIPLYDVTPAELRLALAQLAPAGVRIAEMSRWRGHATVQKGHAPSRPSSPPPGVMATHQPTAVAAPPPVTLAASPPVTVAAPAAVAALPRAPADDRQEASDHMIA